MEPAFSYLLKERQEANGKLFINLLGKKKSIQN